MGARILLRPLWVCLLLVVSATAADAATFYVAPTGSDDNPGTASEPFATLQYAVRVVQPGDTIIIRPGTHTGFEITASGAPGAPIVIRGEQGAVLDVAGPFNRRGDIVVVRNASHIVIESLEVRDGSRAGIAVLGEANAIAESVVIRDVNVHDNELYGIFTAYTRGLLIEDSAISGSTKKDGIAISRLASDTVVRRNVIRGNAASGILVNNDGEPSGGGVIANVTIEGNTLYENGQVGAAAINFAAVTRSRIVNNLLYENHATGIALSNDGKDVRNGSFDNLIAFNTIVQASDGRFAVSLKNGSSRNRVINNILLHPGPEGSLEVDKSSAVDLYSDHNVHTGRIWFNGRRVKMGKWNRKLGQDANSIELTPGELFVDPLRANFRLKAGSPAIDRGMSVDGITTDALGLPRPFGVGVDIGAFEYQGVN